MHKPTSTGIKPTSATRTGSLHSTSAMLISGCGRRYNFKRSIATKRAAIPNIAKPKNSSRYFRTIIGCLLLRHTQVAGRAEKGRERGIFGLLCVSFEATRVLR
jgi:hypothetical protein